MERDGEVETVGVMAQQYVVLVEGVPHPRAPDRRASRPLPRLLPAAGRSTAGAVQIRYRFLTNSNDVTSEHLWSKLLLARGHSSWHVLICAHVLEVGATGARITEEIAR